MIQVTKVWWDGEKLMAEPIDPTTIHQEPAQEKDWGAVGEAHIAAIKKSSKAMVEDAVVRAMPLYTSPPAQRTWVGLTDEQFQAIKDSLFRQEGWDGEGWDLALKEAIEAKLKEKNT